MTVMGAKMVKASWRQGCAVKDATAVRMVWTA
jgi:hypothetical protein